MDFRQIEAFIQVVRLKSFSKAADAIFLTQPTISSHINTLENELGVKLIDRSGKEIVPTKAGKIFIDYANNLVNIRDNAVHTLSEFSNRLEGKLEIASSTVPGQYLLPQLMKEFLQKHSKVNFSILQFDSKQVIEELLEKNIELGIVGTMIENSKIEYIHLIEDNLVLITPNNEKYSRFTNDTITIDIIKDEDFIIRESGSGTRQEFERIFNESAINFKSVNIVAQMNSTESIKQAVSMGLGVSIVSLVSVEDYIKFGQLKAFKISGVALKRAFYLAYHKNRPLSPLTTAFLNFSIKYYKDMHC